MDFQMETDMRMEFQEQIQKFFGSARIEIEGAVKHTDILDAIPMDGFQALADGIYRKCAYRLFTTTYAKSTGVETTACGFQLHERLAPIEEFAFFGSRELVECKYACQSIVMILVVCVYVA